MAIRREAKILHLVAVLRAMILCPRTVVLALLVVTVAVQVLVKDVALPLHMTRAAAQHLFVTTA